MLAQKTTKFESNFCRGANCKCAGPTPYQTTPKNDEYKYGIFIGSTGPTPYPTTPIQLIIR